MKLWRYVVEYNKDLIKLVQKELSEQTGILLKVDGIAGKETLRALLHIEQIPTEWSTKRQVIAYIQYLAATEGIDSGPIDGKIGPQTDAAYDQLKAKLNGETWKPWRDDEGIGFGDIIGGAISSLFDGIPNWPVQTQEKLEAFYGPVGTNQTKVKVPYPLRLAWDKTTRVTRVTCHEKVAPYFVEILEETKNNYGLSEIKTLGLDLFGGALNVRKIRGGTNWSTHAYGCSFDFDPERNKLRWGSDEANFAKPEYEKWFKSWEDRGAVSLGRARGYDFMHTQFCKIRKK